VEALLSIDRRRPRAHNYAFPSEIGNAPTVDQSTTKAASIT